MDAGLYRVNRLRILLMLAGCAATSFGCYELSFAMHRPGKWIFLAGIFAVLSLWALYELMTRTDLSFDAYGIRHKGKSVRWSDVRRIHVSLNTTSGKFGYLIDQSSRHASVTGVDVQVTDTRVGTGLNLLSFPSSSNSLSIEFTGGSFRIPGLSMCQPSDGMVGVARRLLLAQQAALGEHGTARARSSEAQKSPRVRPVVEGVQAERFRRLGLDTGDQFDEEQEPTLAPAPFTPARPQFGRKPA